MHSSVLFYRVLLPAKHQGPNGIPYAAGISPPHVQSRLQQTHAPGFLRWDAMGRPSAPGNRGSGCGARSMRGFGGEITIRSTVVYWSKREPGGTRKFVKFALLDESCILEYKSFLASGRVQMCQVQAGSEARRQLGCVSCLPEVFLPDRSCTFAGLPCVLRFPP